MKIRFRLSRQRPDSFAIRLFYLKMDKIIKLLIVIGFIIMFLRKAEAKPPEYENCKELSTLYNDAKIFTARISKYMDIVDKESKENDIDPILTMAIIWQESSGFPNAMRWEGAEIGYSYGLMGLTLPAARDMGFEGKGIDLLQPDINIKYGVKYLRWQIQRYKGDVEKGISAYNAGHYTEKNRGYVNSVLEKKKAIWQALHCQKNK